MADRTRSGSEDATTYRLIVRGELDQRFAYLFEPMRCERTAGTTVISGTVIDRAHLYGLIERIEELGLELLSLEQTSGT